MKHEADEGKAVKNPLTQVVVHSYETARHGWARRLHRSWCGSARWSKYYFGMDLTGNNTGFYFDLTTLLLKWVIQRRWDRDRIRRVLEIGVGESANLSGYFSRFGGVHVDAVDIREREIETARRHIALNGVDVTAWQSDVFMSVPPRPYDLIFWNLPYREDPEKYLPKLLGGAAGAYLSERGELIIGYNATPLPRETVLRYLQREPALELVKPYTWWWNMHDVLVIGRRPASE